MKTHTIEVDDLIEWQLTGKVLFASSSREEKQLYVTLRGSYEVWHCKELVAERMHANAAVEIYNSLTKRIPTNADTEIDREILNTSKS